MWRWLWFVELGLGIATVCPRPATPLWIWGVNQSHALRGVNVGIVLCNFNFLQWSGFSSFKNSCWWFVVVVLAVVMVVLDGVVVVVIGVVVVVVAVG